MSHENTTLEQIPQTFNKEIVAGNIKAAMGSADAKKRDMYFVPVEALTIMEDFNVRPKNDAYYAAVREIAESIKTNGFYHHKPFAVIVMKEGDKDVLAIYDGHTRYDGLQLAIAEGTAVERVPVIAAPSGTTIEDITVGLVTNNSGRQLEPMAIAIVCKRLAGYGLDNTEISKRLGFTPAYVGGLLNLIGAPKKIRDMVNDGVVSATLAVATLREQGEGAVEALEVGLEIAKEAGKQKVTAKHVVPTDKKPRKPRAVQGELTAVPSKPNFLEAGLDWIDRNGQQEISYAMLAALTGMTIQELKKYKA